MRRSPLRRTGEACAQYKFPRGSIPWGWGIDGDGVKVLILKGPANDSVLSSFFQLRGKNVATHA